MELVKSLNLAVSFLLELAMLAAFSYAGFHTSKSNVAHWIIGLGVPVIIIVFWAIYMAPNASGRLSDSIRQIVSFILFELAAIALYKSHQPKAALILATVTVVNAILVYIWKQ
jgi:chromate transport protein ChrA